MRFYDEVDAIMNRTSNGSSHDPGAADNQADSGRLSMLDDCEDSDHVDVYLTKMNSVTSLVAEMEERSSSSGSVSSVSLDVMPNNEDPRLNTVKELRLDQQHRLSEPISLFIHVQRAHVFLFLQSIPKTMSVTDRSRNA